MRQRSLIMEISNKATTHRTHWPPTKKEKGTASSAIKKQEQNVEQMKCVAQYISVLAF